MKLFQQLLVAPATLGLLAPLSALATEVNFNAISNYSNDNFTVDIDSFNQKSIEAKLISGGEGLVESDNYDSSFSETTTASFGVDMLVGGVDGASTTNGEAVTFGYQMGIGLETSFTGEDALSATIDIGSATGFVAGSEGLNFDSNGGVLTLDGLTYTFPVGGATVLVGDATDISAVYSGACAYSAFTDYMGNCGTGNSVGLGGKGATAAMSYAFDSGFTLAGGISSTPSGILTEEGTDFFGIEAAYAGDSYAVSVAYADQETTTFWGVNASYAFDFATLSAGVESADPEGGKTATGFMVGLSFPEVGPGSFDVGMGTTGNFADGDTETYMYEASYVYPINDGMSITPGIFIKEVDGGDDLTGVAVKTSFSF